MGRRARVPATEGHSTGHWRAHQRGDHALSPGREPAPPGDWRQFAPLRSARNRADYDEQLERPVALAQFAVRRARQAVRQLEAPGAPAACPQRRERVHEP